MFLYFMCWCPRDQRNKLELHYISIAHLEYSGMFHDPASYRPIICDHKFLAVLHMDGGGLVFRVWIWLQLGLSLKLEHYNGNQKLGGVLSYQLL